MEYQWVPGGTKLVFHRSDAFAPQSAAIRRNPPQYSLGHRVWGGSEDRVFSYLKSAGLASSKSLSSELGIPVRTVRDVLKRLAGKGLVESVGKGKNMEYRVSGHDW